MNFNTDIHAQQDSSCAQQVQIICSGILRKDGDKIIYVRFERGKDYAEGSIPGGRITTHNGFTPEELAQFEDYLAEHRFEIIEQAKTVNLMKNFMK